MCIRDSYKLFGVNAELLIDHAWGWEPCTIADIKAYVPEDRSMGSGQVLTCPYDYEKAALVVREMADMLALDLVDKGMVADQVVLTVGYDIENLTDPERRKAYKGEVTVDRYGRRDVYKRQILLERRVQIEVVFLRQRVQDGAGEAPFFRAGLPAQHGDGSLVDA